MNFTLECEQEDDGRWLAEVLELPGALAYGVSQDEAMAKAEALALRVLAREIVAGEGPRQVPHPLTAPNTELNVPLGRITALVFSASGK